MSQPVHIKARVEAIKDHAPGLRSLWFATERRLPRFRAGQFLHLALDAYDPSQHWPDSRCFSIASGPEDRRRLRVTISDVGAFTARMMQLTVGDAVWLKLPYGDFVIEAGAADPGEDIVIVAGGTGIAPFVPFLASDPAPSSRVRVLYGAREPSLLIFAEALDQAASRWPDLKWQAVLQNGARAGSQSGLLNAELAMQHCQDPKRAVFYLSGPPVMIEALQAGLSAGGIAADQIKVDAWG